MTNDDYVARRLRQLANHGIEREPSSFISQRKYPTYYHEMQALGLNGRITDIQCALGISQSKRIAEFKSRRQEIVKLYNHGLKELADKNLVILPPWPDNTDPCFHIYTLRLGSNSGITRDDFYERLRDEGIYCQVHYIPIYRQPYYKEKYLYDLEQFQEAERYYQSCISLPLFPELDNSDIERIIDTIVSIIGMP